MSTRQKSSTKSNSFNAEICRAIREWKLLRVTRPQGSTVIKPHILYLTKSGVEEVSGTYISGYTSSRGETPWRQYNVRELQAVEVLKEQFSSIASDYDPDSDRYFHVLCALLIEESPSFIPLVEIFRAANELVTNQLIENWALGGALAGIYYTEPVTTYDADIFFIPAEKGLSADIPAIYAFLLKKGWGVEGEHLIVHGFPVQFLAANGLTEEAVREADTFRFGKTIGRVFSPEYIIAIAASVGRPKDHARIEQMLRQADVDRDLLRQILKRYKLKLPRT